MRGVSLFSGCGGLDLGLELAGHEIVLAAENEPSAARVLEERFGVRNLGDVSSIAWEELGVEADFLAAGFPCPDFSVAGSRRGLAGERGQLWFEVVRALRALRPRHVVLENVDAIRTAAGLPEHPGEFALGAVLADLASLGYVGSYVRLGALDVGAPHRRLRWFAVASLAERERVGPDGRLRRGDARVGGSSGRAPLPSGEEVARAADAPTDRAGAPPESGRGRRDGRADVEGSRPAGRGGPSGDGQAPPDSGSERLSRGRGADEGGAAGGGRYGRADAEGHSALPPDADELGLARLDVGRGPLEVEAPGPPPPSSDAGRERRATLDPGAGGRSKGTRARGRGTAPPDADGERGEPRSGRRASGGARARPDEAERDGDGLVGAAEPRPGEAAPDADGRRRGGLGFPEPRGIEGPPGGLADGRDALRELGDAEAVEWGAYEPAVRRWEIVLGRRAPRPTDDRGRLNPRFVEWMMGFPDGWTEVEGVARTKRLMMLGNAVQVQCAELVGEWLAAVAERPPGG